MRKAVVMMTILGVAWTSLAAAPVWAQPGTQAVLSFDLRSAPIEDVLRAIQGLVPGFRFVKKPDVKGKVTALMENADLRTAMRKICDEAEATYKLDQGTYIVEAKAASRPRARPRTTPGVGVPIPGRAPTRGGTTTPRTGPRLPRGLPGR